MTKAEKEQAARVYVCPRCHVGSGKPCRSMGGGHDSYRGGVVMPGRAIKGTHEERLELADRFSKDTETERYGEENSTETGNDEG